MGLWTQRRDLTILTTALVCQLILLGYQVRVDNDMSLLRAWVVGAVSPINKGLHYVFSGASSRWTAYVWLVGARDENERMRTELDRLKLENDALRRDLERFDRQKTLVAYQAETVSKTLLAEVIGGGGNAYSKEIMLSKGRRDGVGPGMAVITADGIAGKVQASFPGASLAVLINDPDSGVGVILGDSRVRGVLRGLGSAECLLDHVAPEVSVRRGETVYTAGDDRIYPKGLRVGEVVRFGEGGDFQAIFVRPFARLDRLDEVLIVTAGVHQELPARWEPQMPDVLMPPPPPPPGLEADPEAESDTLTDADRVLERYRALGAAQGHHFGVGAPGAPAPDFNLGGTNAETLLAPPETAAATPDQSDDAVVSTRPRP